LDVGLSNVKVCVERVTDELPERATRPADRPQPQRKPLWTFQKADSIYTCELVLHVGFGSEARILRDGDLLVSRRFEHEWQTLQWTEQERLSIENGGE
jgi:hypothetical protein